MQPAPGYADLLFPGIIALTTMLTALQGTALPLVLDFSFSREIEDRLLAPLPVMAVAVEKMLFAMLRAIVAAAVMFPLGFWILGGLSISAGGVPVLVFAIIVGSLLGAAVGMTLGTTVPPSRINIMFALILTPLIFTGSTQYPWPSLSGIRWFQVITALNPLTYVSETMRGAVVPNVPHMHPAVTLPVMLGLHGAVRRRPGCAGSAAARSRELPGRPGTSPALRPGRRASARRSLGLLAPRRRARGQRRQHGRDLLRRRAAHDAHRHVGGTPCRFATTSRDLPTSTAYRRASSDRSSDGSITASRTRSEARRSRSTSCSYSARRSATNCACSSGSVISAILFA